MNIKSEDFVQLKQLNDMIDGRVNERKILSTLRSLRHKAIPEDLLNKMLIYFKTKDKNTIDMSWFKNQPYQSFMDFFTRKLTDEKYKEIETNAKNSQLIIPNQCFIESIADFSNLKRILRLKKPVDNIIEYFEKVDIKTNDYFFINMKLLVSNYHRIHVPVKGKIKNLTPIEGKDKFFGFNSLWIVEIENEGSSVYLLLVGESTIQDFNFFVEKDDVVDIFDELGYFNWGSQTVLLVPKDKYDINNVLIKEKNRYFAGDKIL